MICNIKNLRACK